MACDADLDEDEFVESISYRETRDYVKKSSPTTARTGSSMALR